MQWPLHLFDKYVARHKFGDRLKNNHKKRQN